MAAVPPLCEPPTLRRVHLPSEDASAQLLFHISLQTWGQNVYPESAGPDLSGCMWRLDRAGLPFKSTLKAFLFSKIDFLVRKEPFERNIWDQMSNKLDNCAFWCTLYWRAFKDWRAFFHHVKQVIAEIMTLSSVFICCNFSNLRVFLVLIHLWGKLHVGREISFTSTTPGHSSGCLSTTTIALSLSASSICTVWCRHGRDSRRWWCVRWPKSSILISSDQRTSLRIIAVCQTPFGWTQRFFPTSITHERIWRMVCYRQIYTCHLPSVSSRPIYPNSVWCSPDLLFTIIPKKINNRFVGGSGSAIFIHVRMKEIKHWLEYSRKNIS